MRMTRTPTNPAPGSSSSSRRHGSTAACCTTCMPACARCCASAVSADTNSTMKWLALHTGTSAAMRHRWKTMRRCAAAAAAACK